MVLMVYSGARGTLIYEKNLKAKISCQTPFKLTKTLHTTLDSALAVYETLRHPFLHFIKMGALCSVYGTYYTLHNTPILYVLYLLSQK